MDITIHASFLPHNDPDASLTFYRDTLGLVVRNDVGYNGMRWITVGPPNQPDTSIVLYPPSATPGITDDERTTILEMMAKGTHAHIILATTNLDDTFAKLQASGADVVQEPHRAALRRTRLRLPRSRRHPHPHPRAALNRPAPLSPQCAGECQQVLAGSDRSSYPRRQLRRSR